MNVTGVSAAVGSVWSIAASGMHDAELRLDVAANNIANANTDGFQPGYVESTELPQGGVRSTVVNPPPLPPDANGPVPSGTDLPTEMVNVLEARRAFEASALVLRVEDRMTRYLLHVLA